MERIAKIVMAVSFGEFESALRRFDWSYQYSDDHSEWRRGAEQERQINQMAKELILIDAKRTVDLYNRYGRSGRGREWRDIDINTLQRR